MSEVTDEQIRDLIELAESGVSVHDMAEVVEVSTQIATTVLRALEQLPPFPDQEEIYGRATDLHGKMKRG